MSKVFIDTNILVYAADKADPGKREKSRSLLRSLRSGRIGVISTQVMQELYVTCVKKLGIEPIAAKSLAHALRNFETVTIDPALIEEAVDCSILNRLSFWDALVVVAAEKARCETLWSEDLNHGQIIRGVRVENPFHDGAGEVHEPAPGYSRQQKRKGGAGSVP